MADRIGQQLGNYRLIRFLGQGGFAEVYLGEHIHLGTLAAIKVLRTQLTPQDGEQFRTEARLIARLIHPHIIRVLDFGIEGTTPFLVMDYAPNGTLRQRHLKGSHVALATVVSYVQQVADALQYAHEQRLVHRDVKPENILIGARGKLLLSDFGIALVAQSSRYQSTQEMAGTMAYCAPEQIQGKPRPASDQYALGIVVYEWLSGDRPFHGSLTELIGQHLTVPPPPLRQKMPTLSIEVEQVVMTTLAKDSQQRFGSITAFAMALEKANQTTQRTGRASIAETVLPHPLPSLHPIGPVPPVREASTNLRVPEEHILPFAGAVHPHVQTPLSTEGRRRVVEEKQAHKKAEEQSHVTADIAANQIAVPSTREGALSSDASEGPSQQALSRRAVIVGLAGAAVVGGVSSAYVLFSHRFPSTQGQSSRHPTATARPTYPAAVARPSNLALNSSGAMFGYDAQHTNFNPRERQLSPTNVSHLVQYWTAPTGDKITNSPTVADSVVYIGSDRLYAFDASHGTLLWRATTGSYIGSTPAVANGVVYVGSGDSKLYAFNTSHGALLWKAPTSGQIQSSPAVVNGVVYIGSTDTNLYAFDASNGTQLWKAKSGGAIFSAPAVANGVVYVCSNDSKLYAFDVSNGTRLWSAESGGAVFSAPVVVNSTVYVGSDKLYAFNASRGTLLWETSGASGNVGTSPAIANGVAYVGDGGGSLNAFNASSGARLWSTALETSVYATPTAANGVVYICCLSSMPPINGLLYAFDASSKAQLWSGSTGNSLIGGTGASIYSMPVVANGVVYIGSTNSNLYAFHVPGTTP